jgi:hypothetical protein
MSVDISKTVTDGGTVQLVQVNVCLQDTDWQGNFDRIEIERSRGLSTGPFEPLTADVWTNARIPADGGAPATGPVTGPTLAIVGETLELLLGEEYAYTVTFTDPGPGTLTVQQAAAQIQFQVPLLQAWVDDNARLVLQTVMAGTGAALRVVGGDAAPALLLPTTEPDSVSFGKDARLALVLGKERYCFRDLQGSDGYFYRMRFFDTATGATSSYGAPAPVPRANGLGCEDVVEGRVRLVALNGRPLCGVQVRVFNRAGLFEKSGALVSGNQLTALTDASGVASFSLVRGMTVEVAIDGTSLVRQITVPEDPAEGVFNLLDPAIGPDDYFRVKHPDIQYAYKRTL